MGSHENWTDRLSDYLDGELPPEERAEIRRHVSTCVECTRVLEELNGIVAKASKLGDLQPNRDLWPSIAMRIAGAAVPPGRRASVPVRGVRPSRRLPVPRLLAVAAIASLALWAAGSWIGSRTSGSPGESASIDDPAAPPAVATAPQAPPSRDTAGTGAAIAQLEREFAENRAVIDPYMVEVIENNLALIDQAIEESKQALANDPESDYLNGHLADTLRRKAELLRDANTVAARNQ
jgi:anti-sigma factor RsiW